MKSIIKVFAIGVLWVLVVFAGNSGAEMKSEAFSLTPLVGGYVFEGNQNLDNGVAYGLGLGYNFDQHSSMEAIFKYIDTDSDIGRGNVEGYQYRLDYLYHFLPDQILVPYLAAGAGAITLDPDRGGSETDFLVNYGAGVKYFINETMALRLDVRHVIPFDDTQHNFAYTFGVSFNFGGKEKVVPSVVSDGDGVTDDIDQSPRAPQEVKVDAEICPLDSDGDGVGDDRDQCPDTPRGAEVDTTGCPLDSDGDGVYDGLDQCPGTPLGVDVDEKGCPRDMDGDGVYDYGERG